MPPPSRLLSADAPPARSPTRRLAAARGREFKTHTRATGDALCPFRLLAAGFSFDAPKSVFPEHLCANEDLVIWRYVVAGGLLWESGHSQVRLSPGMVLATHQPAPARLVVAPQGVAVFWLLFVGAPARDYFDRITARFGAIHAVPPTSPPVRLAEELVRTVRTGRPRSPFFWSAQAFRFLSVWHEHLERHRPPVHRLLALPPAVLRRQPVLPRSVKSLAGQLGYSASHLTRQFAQRWQDTPGRLLRTLRLEEAARRLSQGAEPVQTIAGHAGYASVPAFITAFKRKYRCTPLAYRHEHR